MRGIYRGKDKITDESQFIFHWNYLNEKLKKTSPLRADQAGYYIIELTGADRAGQVSIDVDAIFKNSRAETLTETEKAFQQSFVSMSETIVITIQVVSFMVIIIIMAVVANTMAMTTRERIGEYAVLKTLGFSGRQIAALIFGESLVIAFIGCAFGIVMTFPAAKVFSQKLSTFFPVFNIEIKTVCMDIIAAFWVGIIAAVIPTRQAIKIRIADGLRRIG